MKAAFRLAIKEVMQYPFTMALFLSPLLVFFILLIAKDAFCVQPYLSDPSQVIWHSFLWLALVAALCQLNQPFCTRAIGTDPIFGTQLFALMIFCAAINSTLAIPLGLVYMTSQIFWRTLC